MINAVEARYGITYERNAAASYLVIDTDYREEIQGYQYEMIANNPNPGILPLYTGRTDSRMRFYYNITSKVPLIWLLKRKKLKKNELIAILCGIMKPLLEACNCLLAENKFLIDESYIYVSPELTEISLVYLPEALEADYAKCFREFVVRLITTLADIEESPSDNYFQRILGIIRQESFNIIEFDRALKEMSYSGSSGISNKADEAPEDNNEGLAIPPGESPERPLRNETAANKVKTIDERVKYVVLVQIGIILAFIGLYISGLFKGLNRDDLKSAYAGAALIAGAVDFLAVKKILSGKNKAVEAGSAKAGSAKASSVETSSSAKQENREENKIISESNVLSSEGRSSETVFLTDVKETEPFLQGCRNGAAEKIPITKKEFIIGRLEGQADYICSNNAVGKVHAEIICKDGLYYIKDLNSKNGTFVNGERIESNTESEIKNNDSVSFANCEYTFVIPHLASKV